MFTEIYIRNEDKTAQVREFVEAIGLEAIASGRYSTNFAVELYCHSVLMGTLSPSRVMAEVEALENPVKASATKPPVRFNRLPLKGLWHKHYQVFGVPSMATNLRNALNKYGLPKLEEKVRGAVVSGEERYFSAADIAEVVDEAVRENYERRHDDSEMTGEWIVYAIHEGQNYYLCLGMHKSGDDSLRQKIDSICVPEFPFLADILAPAA